MRIMKAALVLLGILLLGGALIPSQADTFNKKTKVTFSQPVQIPGRTLPAGTYTFTILDAFGERNIVQIWDADEFI